MCEIFLVIAALVVAGAIIAVIAGISSKRSKQDNG